MLELAVLTNFIFCGAIGAILGTVELLGRYRDDPWRAIKTRSAALYIIVNILAAILAYHLIRVFDVRFGISDNAAKLVNLRIMLAGLGAMAFFRTSLFTVRVADTDVAVGPGMILQVLLNVTDRTLDRDRALPRADEIPALMNGIDFSKAGEALPAFCFGVMQNVTSDEQAVASAQIAVIAKTSLSNKLKANLLGLLLLNLVGKTVLASAIKALGDEIRLQSLPSA